AVNDDLAFFLGGGNRLRVVRRIAGRNVLRVGGNAGGRKRGGHDTREHGTPPATGGREAVLAPIIGAGAGWTANEARGQAPDTQGRRAPIEDVRRAGIRTRNASRWLPSAYPHASRRGRIEQEHDGW